MVSKTKFPHEPAALVTVIIPTFNRRKWIGQCIDSVLAQTYPKIEIIVVDDKSTDDTVEWLESHPRYAGVRLRVQEQNGGASTARNTAIEMSSGELIVFIDSDDILLPNHVETAVALFEQNPDLGLFCCDSKLIDPEGNEILNGKTWHQALSEAKNINIETGFREFRSVFSHSNCFPGFTLRRGVFTELGGFDQSIFPADDYDLALRVAASKYKVYYLHEPLCMRREHDGQCSGIQNSVKTQLKLIEALERAVTLNPEVLTDKLKVARRMAEIRFELAISEIKEGRTAPGIARLVKTVMLRPEQVITLAKIGGRKLRRIAGHRA